jgi:hypothetical protein
MIRPALIAFFLFVAASSGLAQTDLPTEPPTTIVADPSAFLIPRDQLSTQASDPYLFMGRVMDRFQKRWSEFEPFITRFPDTSSCLLPEERGRDEQNLLNFDWKAMKGLQDIEVCVFRVAHSLDDVQLLRAWLTAQGYRIADGKVFCHDEPDSKFPNRDVCSFAGIMAPDLFAEKTSIFEQMSLPWRLIYRKTAIRHGLQIGLSETMRVVDVFASVDTES